MAKETNGRDREPQSLAVTIGRNTVFGVAARVAQVLTRLVTIPIVIAHLGLGGYGIWSIIMTAAAYMRFGSVGIKSAFQKYVAESTGNGDYGAASKLLSTGSAVMLALSVTGLIPIALYSPAIAKSAGVPAEFLTSAAKAISVLAVIMVMSNVGAAYEAVLMGAHRIDIARTFTTAFTVGEAIAIVVVLHLGGGLFSMAVVMAGSEVGFVASCYFASRRIVPEIKVAREYVCKSVLYELFRFAGSYQLVNVLEVLYGAILPVAILRGFGADASGVYALASRLVTSAMMLPDALLLPILSGGTMVYVSGSQERIKALIVKAFKVTLGLTLFPLGFIAFFGSPLVYAWTGETPAHFGVMVRLICLAGFFQAFSLLGLVLYRISGNALLDNVRQVLRIIILFSIALFAKRLGLYGVLIGLAAAELSGMAYMLFAITKTFHGFRAVFLMPDSLRLTLASVLVFLFGMAAMKIPLTFGLEGRPLAALQVAKVCFACVSVTWPALWLTKSLTPPESKAISRVFFPRRFASEPHPVDGVS